MILSMETVCVTALLPPVARRRKSLRRLNARGKFSFLRRFVAATDRKETVSTRRVKNSFQPVWLCFCCGISDQNRQLRLSSAFQSCVTSQSRVPQSLMIRAVVDVSTFAGNSRVPRLQLLMIKICLIMWTSYFYPTECCDLGSCQRSGLQTRGSVPRSWVMVQVQVQDATRMTTAPVSLSPRGECIHQWGLCSSRNVSTTEGWSLHHPAEDRPPFLSRTPLFLLLLLNCCFLKKER